MHSTGQLDILQDRRDQVSRVRFPMECIAAEDAQMSWLLRYWNDLRPNGVMLPHPKSVDPVKMSKVIGRLHKVDTRSRDPEQYYFRLWGSLITLDSGRNLTNARVADYPSEPYAQATMQDYHDVVMSGVPAYQQIRAIIDHMPYNYSRLILPLSEDGRLVDQLLVCVNERPLDIRFDRAHWQG